MTNLEKYKDKFGKELSQEPFCFIALKLRIYSNTKDKIEDCDNRNCIDCLNESLKWLTQEYTESKKEFTQDELAVLKHIDKKWKWIARDEDNVLYFYSEKPYKASGCWADSNMFEYMRIFNCFKQIQWEDSEPVFIDDYVDRKGE